MSGNLLIKFLVSVFCLSAFFSILQAQKKEEIIVARITARDFSETMRIAQMDLDLMEYREGDDLFVWTTEKQLNELQASGLKARVDETRTAELQSSFQTDTFNGGYRTVEETRAFLAQMAAQYPNLAQTFEYGQSWEKTRNAANGYDLFGIKLTNRNVAGNKPTFFLEAGIHARELVPPEIATRFVEYLLKNYNRDADATWLLDEHQIIVIPIVNPDGRKVAETNPGKRKNTNNLSGACSQTTFGIDLNRNFQYFWGTINTPTADPPCSETFPGLTAASEPETQGIQNLVNSLFPDQRGPLRTDPAPPDATGVFLDMHSTGNLVLYPWGEDNLPPPNLQLATIAKKMASYNGYNPIQSIVLYPTSGTAREYAYGELGVAGFGMEIGPGSGSCGGFAPAYSCIEGGTNGNFWGKNLPALLYLSKIARTPYMTSEGATAETLSVTRTASANTFALRAQISDAANGNQNVAAAEVYIDTPPWRGGTPIAMTAEDGAFNSPIEFAVANVNVAAGRHVFYVRGRDAENNWGAVKAAFTPRNAVIADFDGDNRTDISVFRPSNGVWYVNQSGNNAFRAEQFGTAADRLTPGDYDGDGKTDLAVFRNGTWFVIKSQSNAFSSVAFGLQSDIPAAADFDGDGRTDYAVFRPSNGIWYVSKSSDNQLTATQFGANGDVPIVGDYDGDGRSDYAVFRPTNGVWYLLRSQAGFTGVQFGLGTDKTVPADYDGDGKTDIAVFRNGNWYLQNSTTGFTVYQFGVPADVPSVGDYDGDGKSDIAVFRDGIWYVQQTTAGFKAQSFGVTADKPVPAAY